MTVAGWTSPFVLSDLCCVAVAAGPSDVARAEQLDRGGSRVGRAAAVACAAVLDGVDLRTAARAGPLKSQPSWIS